MVDRAKRFSLFAHRLAEYDGEAFELDEHWRADRTLLTTPLGPRYCFNACNEQETAGTSATIVSAIDKALGDCYPRYAVTGDFVAARCHRSQTVVRIHVPSMKVETLPGLPSTNLGDDRLVLTLDGHVVIQLGVLMQRYMVWSHDTGELSPARSLEQGEILAQTSPTVLVRGLPEPLPRATVSAVAMGQPLSFNPRDIDRANHAIDRGPGAHHARSERAAAVLPKGDFVIAHEAAVQLACGAYVRAPIGYEGEPFAHDFDPPVMPPLSPKAVHQPEPCLPLAEVHAVPGAPDLLLAKTADGQLATAWLPPPLPVTAHTDRRRPMPEPPAGPPPEPRPGPGWVVLGPIDSIAGIPGSPSPGTNPPAMSGWQRGGGAVLTVDGSTIVLTPGGVWTVPDGTKGMAVQLSPEAKLYGALGAALVVCDNTCRTLTPSDGREILSVVPRTQGEVIIGYGEGEEDATVVRLPARGGTETAAHALQESLRAQLRARPVP